MSPTTSQRVKVGISDYAVADGHCLLSTSGLGSCLGIVIYDSTASVAGLLHAMLPEATHGHRTPAKFVDTGVEAMLTELNAAGAARTSLAAKIVGGSTMLDLSTTGDSIGDRNIEATRTILAAADIPIVAEDVGGEYGRSVQFDIESTELSVKTAYQGTSTI